MVIIPFSLINEILQQYQDFEVDKKTNVNTTVQKFDSSYITKLLATLVLIVIVGLSIIIFSIPFQFRIVNLIISVITGVLVIYRVNIRASNVMQLKL